MHAMLIPDQFFHITRGEPAPQSRTNDKGRVLNTWYCAQCGTPVLGMVRGAAPDLYRTVRVGTLDDTRGLPPPIHVWTRGPQEWFVFPPEAKRFAEAPSVPIVKLLH